MPAIDPERLERELTLISEHFDQPDLLRRYVLDLLDFYADRAKRPGAATRADDVPWSFGVPRPVQRSLAKALVDCGVQRPEAALPAAEGLWQSGFREGRLLALAILSGQTGPEVASWVEAHVPEAQDSQVLQEAAGTALEAWRLSDPSGFLHTVVNWSLAREGPLQALGLLALEAAVEDERFDRLPSLLLGLDGLELIPRGDGRRALTNLVRALARRTPPEAARFLLDQKSRGTPGIERLIRGCLDAFPPPQRQRLSQALSG